MAAAAALRRLSSPCIRPSLRSPIPRLSRAARLSPAQSPSSLRRASVALASLLPAHSALASARLVSKLSKEPSAYIEGRFANYLSPI